MKSSLTRINMESLNKADMEFILPKEDKTAACNSAGICQNETTIQSLDTKTKLQGGGVWGLDFKPTKDTKNRANREGIWCCFLLFQKEIQPLDRYCEEKRKYYLYYHWENWETVRLHPQDKVITIRIKCISTRRVSFGIYLQYIIMFTNINAE